MKYAVSFGFLVSISLYVSGQVAQDRPRFRIPSLSDILRDTGTIETSVVDLSAATDSFDGAFGGVGVPAIDFAAPQNELAKDHGSSGGEPAGHAHGHAHGHDVQHGNEADASPIFVTDVNGNTPPPPTGTHVDLPGEHGNMNDFPVIHHGEAPIQTPHEVSPPVDNDIHHDSRLSNSGSVHDSGNTVPIPMESSHGPNTVSMNPENIDHSSNPFHAANVHHIAPETRSSSRNFDDLTAIGNDGLGFTGNELHPELPVGTLTDIPRDHASAPHISTVTNVNPGASVSNTDGFVSQTDGFMSKPSEIHNDLSIIATPIKPQASGNVHVDLPGEHANPIDGVPLIHREIEPHENSLNGGPAIHREINGIGTHAGTPVGNVHVDMPGEHGNPIEGHPVIHREGHHGSGSTVHQGSQTNFGSQPIGNVHVDMHEEHRNSASNLPTGHTEAGTRDGHRQHVDLSGIHIDAPGEHGNMLNEPALHLPPGATIQDAIDAGVIPDPSGSGPGFETPNVGPRPTTSVGNIHVDMPGEHGNPPDGHPVVHREDPHGVVPQTGVPAGTGHIGPHIGTHAGNVHVDMPGQHGNPLDGHPVVHREGPHGLVPQTGVQGGRGSLGPHTGTHAGSVHVDMPGQHGNPLDGHPVVHREGPHGLVPQTVVPVGIGSFGPHTGTHAGNVHVDMPGQHDNPLDGHPVVHREGPHGLVPQTGVPVGTGSIGPHSGTHAGNVHVDMPGQHGNRLDGHPVVHREGPHGLVPQTGVPVGIGSFGPQTGTHAGNVHVDMPDQHGNPLDGHPVVHREGPHNVVPHIEVPVGTGSFGPHAGNVHVDLPGQHGTPLDGHPVIHREGPLGAAHQGMTFDTNIVGSRPGIPLGSIHVDMPGEHGNLIDGHPVIHREDTHPGSKIGSPLGNIHVDMPGEHVDPIIGYPTIRRDGPVLRPVVQTGVLPGTINVPVAPKRSESNEIFRRKFEKSLGDLLGVPTVRLSESIGSNLERTNIGLVNDNNVLLTKDVRRRDKRKRGEKRGGKRGRGRLSESIGSNLERTNIGLVNDNNVLLTKDVRRRDKKKRGGKREGKRGRGRGRGQGGRRRRTTTTTTTTTTPKKTGGGITIIRTSRPNPLAALGNAFRSALNVNSGGGGLLGSLFRSAVGAQQRPVRIQPVRGGLFGRIFGG